MKIGNHKLKGIPICSTLEEIIKINSVQHPLEITINPTLLLLFQNYVHSGNDLANIDKVNITIYPRAILTEFDEKGQLYFYHLFNPYNKKGLIEEAVFLEEID